MRFLLLFLLFFPLIAFSNKINDLNKEIYNNCESSQKSFNNSYRLDSKEKAEMCNYLLRAKANNSNKSLDNFLFDKSKQYHLGFKMDSFYFKHSERYQAYSMFFESRIIPILYVGAQLGIFENLSNYHNKDLGAIFQPYLRFAPFYMLQYFDFGLSSGILTYYIGNEETDILITFNVYLGFKIANTVRFNIEFGSGSENLFHFGAIFGILLF